MSVFRVARALALFVCGLVLACTHTRAQGLALSVTNSASSITLGNSITYSIRVTNLTGTTFPNVLVTNTFSGPVTINNATNSQGIAVTNVNSVLFILGQMFSGQNAQMFVTVTPNQAGLFTNAVLGFAPDIGVTNGPSNSVVLVTNSVTAANLGVSISGPATGTFVNDSLTIITTITNSGPATASNVAVTNFFSDGVVYVSSSPSNLITVTSNSVAFFFGVVSNRAVRTATLTVQPTNAGVLVVSAQVGSPGNFDTNSNNNAASTNLTVSAFIGQLVAVTNSAQTLNPQTGLLQQTVLLSNVGTTAVASARVVVTGLTNQLFNAVGTSGGSPYVVYPNTLDTNQSVSLLLEFFEPTRQPFPLSNAQLQALGVSAVDVTSPNGTNGAFLITSMATLPSGGVLIEFQSIPGRRYSVLYSDSLDFTNVLVAQPSILAPADRVQWIDDGPPKTISAPTNAASRFYRVLINP